MSDLPDDVAERATELTRRAREAVDDAERAAYLEDRDALLAEYGYVARVRSEDTRDVLVCHPEEWLGDGVVRVDRIEDTSRAVERPLSGPGEGDDWAAIDAHNREIADRIAEEFGPTHGATARAFADFMSNHYAKPMEKATPREREEFRTEYLPRNAWPTEEQLSVLDETMAILAEPRDYS